jgi:hypothetical protein
VRALRYDFSQDEEGIMKSNFKRPFIAFKGALIFWSVAALVFSYGKAGDIGQISASAQKELQRFSRVPAKVRTFRTAKEVTISTLSPRLPEGRFPETAISTSGLAAATADRMNGRVWVMAMSDGLSPEDYADAGFKSTAFSFSGSETIRGATATATILVRRLELEGESHPLAVFALGIYKDGNLVASGRAMVDARGTYTATTTAIDLSPGARYHVEARMHLVTRTGVGSRGMVSDAEITEIRWSF